MKNLLLIAFILFFLGCNKKYDVGLGSKSCTAYPLSIGNSWIYKSTFYNSKGTTDSVKTQSLKLSYTTNYNGNPYFIIDSFYYPLRSKDCTTLALFDPNINAEIDLKTNSDSNNLKVYDTPPAGIEGSCKHGTKIFLNKDRITIKGHDCYKIEFQLISCAGVFYSKRYYFVNEQVGLVETEGYNIVSGVAFLADKEELQSYELR